MSLQEGGKGVIRLRVGVTLPREVPEEGLPAANPGLGGKGLLFQALRSVPCVCGERGKC